MAATILEIAKKLNLSHTTVSRVLNDKRNAMISEETRRRVLAAAREMGYRPNLAARSLRDSKTNVVGIFGSPYVGIWSGLAPDIVREASRVLHARQFDLFFAFSAEEAHHKMLPAWRCDGAIVLQTPPPATVRYLTGSGQPLVCINEHIEGQAAVLCDDAGGTRLALEYLWELGHRHIAYANATQWHFDHYSVAERHSAYLGFLQTHGAAPHGGHDDRTAASDRTAFLRRTVLDEKATAILAYDHVVAVDILAAAQALNLRVPHDFSLICFNDEFPVDRVYPPLTVIAPQAKVMGRVGAELLLEQLDADDSERLPTILRTPEELIIRRSTAARG